MNRYVRLLGSKTVIGAAGVICAWLASLPVIDIKHAIGGAGALLATAGARDAFHTLTDAVGGTRE